ncbi:hypothetical protein GCM10022253_20510 [Sphingomonas endophytica]|uniref:Uncharacterized protein n=1 Tax=Sphingomonas endophytica TaxID=869719 RepID=A0ABR6N1M8_9SPHN|nr:hypothetical protein [Sphingomonas endophytica]
MATPEKNADQNVPQRLSDLLDRVLVRAENGYSVQDELHKMVSTLEGSQWTNLLARAQGSVGLVNSTTDGSSARAEAYAAVTSLKRELRSLASNAQSV